MGLPLAVEFAKKYSVVGFDISQNRVNELKSGVDSTLEISDEVLSNIIVNNDDKSNENIGLKVSVNSDDLKDCNFYIVNSSYAC